MKKRGTYRGSEMDKHIKREEMNTKGEGWCQAARQTQVWRSGRKLQGEETVSVCD